MSVSAHLSAKTTSKSRFQVFQDDLVTLAELSLHSKKLHTSADARKTYYDAIQRCVCVLRDIGYEVDRHASIIEDKKKLGQDTTKHMQHIEKVKKTCFTDDDARKLLHVLDKTREYSLPAEVEDTWASIDASEDEDAIRRYIKEIHGF